MSSRRLRDLGPNRVASATVFLNVFRYLNGMSAKKSKALERELMDDLLEDPSANSKQPDSKESVDVPADEGDAPSVSVSIDLEDKSVKIGTEKTESNQTTVKNTNKKKSGSNRSDDPTIRLPDSTDNQSTVNAGSLAGRAEDEVRASVGRFGGFRNVGTPTGAALAQSENLRIAQGRILELENEVERLRIENEKLAAAGETFRRKSDELTSKADDLDNRYQNAVSTHEQEKALLLGNKESLRHELEQLKGRNEELEARISTNIQKIRVRERELENRLELVKMEGAAMVRSKDELILDLKRQIDQLNLELNNYRAKSQELNRVILDKQDILRRTVKALRLALTMLEGDSESSQPQKKAK